MLMMKKINIKMEIKYQFRECKPYSKNKKFEVIGVSNDTSAN